MREVPIGNDTVVTESAPRKIAAIRRFVTQSRSVATYSMPVSPAGVWAATGTEFAGSGRTVMKVAPSAGNLGSAAIGARRLGMLGPSHGTGRPFIAHCVHATASNAATAAGHLHDELQSSYGFRIQARRLHRLRRGHHDGGQTAELNNETLRERLRIAPRNAEEQQHLKDFVICERIRIGQQPSAHPAPVLVNWAPLWRSDQIESPVVNLDSLVPSHKLTPIRNDCLCWWPKTLTPREATGSADLSAIASLRLGDQPPCADTAAC
jgi:hypothetical protein